MFEMAAFFHFFDTFIVLNDCDYKIVLDIRLISDSKKYKFQNV